MLVSLIEPTITKSIYINPDNNLMHVLIRVTDDSGNLTNLTMSFWSALDELRAYKSSLEFDLRLLNDHPLHGLKQARLAQIKMYIDAIKCVLRDISKIVNFVEQKSLGFYNEIGSEVTNPLNVNRGQNAMRQVGAFVQHQGIIYLNFSVIGVLYSIQSSHNWANWLMSGFGLFRPKTYFQSILEDFENTQNIPFANEHIQAQVELSIKELISYIKDDSDWKKFPSEIMNECKLSFEWQLHQFLHYVAQGKQNDAGMLLNECTQSLLNTPGLFTDYSGRIFECTAYEYAWWARDKHMCGMLESHMDEVTKSKILVRIDKLKANGLTFKQHNTTIQGSQYFNLSPLIEALSIKPTNWQAIATAQCDLPAHIIHEYCRDDRDFKVINTSFNEKILPRTCIFVDLKTNKEKSVYPLSATSGLGIDYCLFRAERVIAIGFTDDRFSPRSMDLKAIIQLDKVREADLDFLHGKLSSTIQPPNPRGEERGAHSLNYVMV